MWTPRGPQEPCCWVWLIPAPTSPYRVGERVGVCQGLPVVLAVSYANPSRLHPGAPVLSRGGRAETGSRAQGSLTVDHGLRCLR